MKLFTTSVILAILLYWSSFVNE